MQNNGWMRGLDSSVKMSRRRKTEKDNGREINNREMEQTERERDRKTDRQREIEDSRGGKKQKEAQK